MTARITLRQFAMSYPSFSISPLSVDLRSGERVALVGPNGSGKSTTLRALAGRIAGYTGSILLDGRDLRGLFPAGRSLVGFLPECLACYGWMTVREHLDLVRSFHPLWDAAYEAHLVDCLRVPLGQPIGALSKGTRVKVSFIAAEAYRPPILLLDEPTSGLDPETRRELLEEISDSVDVRPDRVVLFSTHLLEDVEFLASRVLLIEGGRIGLDATVTDLRRSHGEASLTKILYANFSKSRM